MLRLAVKNLAQNKIRLLLTTFAIVLGVGFVVSSFVLRDGLKEIFNNLATEVVAGLDLAVESLDRENNPVGPRELDSVLALDGIRDAGLTITGEGEENRIQPIKPDGTIISLQGPPQLAIGWSDAPWSASSIVDGRAPAAIDEWVIDPLSLIEHGFVVGDTYNIETPAGLRTAELVGTFTFDGIIEGPTYLSFLNESLQEYLLYDSDRFDSLLIVADGSVPLDELRNNVTAALGADDPDSLLLVQTQQDLITETQGDFNEVLDIIGAVLLGFALVSLFVSIFIISNTFAITTSQRTRELGLLRAIGATPRQIMKSVVAESVVIGLVASLTGIGAGVVIAIGLRAILNQVGVGIPAFGIVLAPATVIYAFIVGTLVTVLAAIFPAIGAARTSPIAAITGQSNDERKSVVRFVIAAAITTIGLALMALGLFGNATGVTEVLIPLGIGSGLLFIGITLLSPLVAGPLSRIIGAPLSIPFGTAGHLAKENSARNPRRTATTAAALMIGLSLVSGASVLGESFKAEFENILNSAVQADFLVTSNSDQASIRDEVVERIQENEAFGNVSPVKYTNVMVEQDLAVAIAGEDVSSREAAAFDYANIDGLFNLSVTQGALTDIDSSSVALRDTFAEELNLTIGDSISVAPDDQTDGFAELEIVAIFEEAQVSGEVLVDLERFEAVAPRQANNWVAARIAEDVSVATAEAEFAALGSEFPTVMFQSSAEFRQTFSEQIDFALNLLTVLLGLTIFIALLGIANTLALSVFERTRELGLLRAVGMVRRQTRRMIRWEAVIISAVGAVLGTILGVALGAIIVTAIPGQFLSAFAIPWPRIVIMVLFASLAGIFAALFPAWRASRMNVLSAINSE